jgi:hypothetical protein
MPGGERERSDQGPSQALGFVTSIAICFPQGDRTEPRWVLGTLPGRMTASVYGPQATTVGRP